MQSREPLQIFVGYDSREIEAFEVCAGSLHRHSSRPLAIQGLYQWALRKSGLYRRAPIPDTRRDSVDHLPFSTEFTFTRFLIPALMQWQGWALYCDCDFLFTQDVAKLFALRDEAFAIMVVPHLHDPKERTKMDGVAQTRYAGKNRSSLILWNCGHRANQRLSVDQVNNEGGLWLHNFSWLETREVGWLPETWNYLEGWSRWSPDLTDVIPAAIHFTRGGPWLTEWQDVEYADLWRKEKALGEKSMARV